MPLIQKTPTSLPKKTLAPSPGDASPKRRGRGGRRKMQQMLRFRWAGVEKVLAWVGDQFFGIDLFRKDFPLFRGLLSELRGVVDSRGIYGSVDYFKSTRAGFRGELAHLGTKEESRALRRIGDRGGHGLQDVVQKSLDANPESIKRLRMVQTALYSLRLARRLSKPDTSPVDAPFSGRGWNREYIRGKAVEFWKSLGYDPATFDRRKATEGREYHFSTHAGPNGPAIGTSLQDLATWRQVYPDLWEKLLKVGGKRLRTNVALLDEYSCMKTLKDIVPTEPGILRRIAFVADPELKVRLVAIADYWTQTVFKRFHDLSFEVLRKIDQDVTFRQDRFLELVRGGKDVESFHSLDLTSATDRFPIDFISDVGEPLLGREYVSSWKDLFTKIPFTIRGQGGVPTEEKSFSVGTPLGLYGSWGPFAVAVSFIQWLIRGDWTGQFATLGDDYLTGDSDLERGYRELLLDLGVEVSEKKTWSSPVVAEFAKRDLMRCRDGTIIEFTAFPVSLIGGAEASVPLLVSALYGEMKKGLVPRSGVSGAIAELDGWLSSIYGPSSLEGKRIRRRKRAARQTDTIYQLVQGMETAEECVKVLLRGLPAADQEGTPERSRALVARSCAEMYRNSVSGGARGSGDSGFIPEIFKALLSSRDRALPAGNIPAMLPSYEPFPPLDIVFEGGDPAKAVRLCRALPHLGTYARLEKVMIRDLTRIKEGSGPIEEWPDFVRAVHLGVSGVDPRVSEKSRRILSCSLLAKTIVLEAHGQAWRKGDTPPISSPYMYMAEVLGIPFPFKDFESMEVWRMLSSSPGTHLNPPFHKGVRV